MTKIAITADIHLRMWPDTEFSDEGIPKRLIEILDALEQVCVYSVQNGINTIVIAGDVNDLKNVAHVTAWVEFKNLLRKYPQLQFIILHGNHDRSQQDLNRSSVQLLDDLENVRTVVRREEVDLITFIPHSKHIAEDVRNSGPSKLMVGHFGLSDASLSNGMSIRSDLNSGTLTEKFDLTILGHYHKPQEIRNNKVIYVGSPIQLRRDEVNEEKRFIVVDKETLEWESIPLVGARRYYRLVIAKKDEVKKIMEEAKKLREDGNYVILVNELKYAPTEIPEDVVFIDNYQEESQMRGITMGMGMEDQMKRYMEMKNIDPVEQDEYMKVGQGILEASEESELRRSDANI